MAGRGKAKAPPPPPPPSAGSQTHGWELLPILTGLPAEPHADVIFERAHLEEVPHAAGIGGKTACQWQRALRTECIANDVSFKDISDDPLYNWKQVLRSADEGLAHAVIGQGIVCVLFRIVDTERDPNYTNIDGHGRHFFEFVRADGSAMRLHYHKKGHIDEPTVVAPPHGVAQTAVPQPRATQPEVPGDGAAQPAMASGGAAQPAELGGDAPVLFTLDHLLEAARSRQTIGRNEASTAFQTLLHHYCGETVEGAVDITNGSAFDWPRWLAGIEGARNVIRDGVHRVYVVRWTPNWAPEAVFCYGNYAYSTVQPSTVRYTGSRTQTPIRMYRNANWMTEPLLSAAPVAETPWLVLRDQVRWD